MPFILILSLSLLIILTNFRLLVFDEEFYLDEAEKLNNLRYEDEYLNVIDYLKGDKPLMFFNEKENLHMEDVKHLIQIATSLWYISIIFAIISLFYFAYTHKYDKIFSALRTSSIIIIILLSILTLLSIAFFDKFFLYFHKIFFTNDLWILNPLRDLLINLFPQQFFIDFIRKLIIQSYIVAIIALLFTILAKTLKKKKL